ncbi:7657_t:CDS:1, partial [Gigaspora rosea]
QSVEISTMFQQKSSNRIIPDLHIIKQIRDANVHVAKYKQVVNKKVLYATGFRKIKKALNIALDLECEDELINIITRFIDEKKFTLENINS